MNTEKAKTRGVHHVGLTRAIVRLRSVTMFDPSPFHEGEQRVQAQLGVRDDIEPRAQRVIRPYLPEEHRRFHTRLPFLVAAARDAQGRSWVTLLTGAEGFVHSPDAGKLLIDARPRPGDALERALVAGAELGLLGIDLATRRRNRVNGDIVADGPTIRVSRGPELRQLPAVHARA